MYLRAGTDLLLRWHGAARGWFLTLSVRFVSPIIGELSSYLMSRLGAVLVGTETGDGGVWGRSEEGRDKTLRPLSSVKCSDKDRRWVPPWPPPVKEKSKQWSESGDGGGLGSMAVEYEKASRLPSSGRPSDEYLRCVLPGPSQLKSRLKKGSFLLPSVRAIATDVGFWACATDLRKLKVKSQMHSKITIVRFLELEASDLLEVSILPTTVCLRLKFAINWTDLIAVDFLMLRIVALAEVSTLGVLCSALCEWAIQFTFPLGRGFYKSFPIIGYAWLRVSVSGGVVEHLADQLSKDCAIDRKFRIIGLSMFSRYLCVVQHWLNVCLFSVLLNTVHYQGRHKPVRRLWTYCSSLGWGSISLPYCPFNCAICDVMIHVLLEYFLAPRNLVRNPSCRCVPIEANLAVKWIVKASLERSCPVVWAFRPPFLLQAFVVYGAEDDLVMYLSYGCNKVLLISCFSKMLARVVGLCHYFFSLFGL